MTAVLGPERSRGRGRPWRSAGRHAVRDQQIVTDYLAHGGRPAGARHSSTPV